MSESTLSIHGLSTAEMDDVFSPDALVGHMLEFEAALAAALGRAGVAPPEQAEVVALACREPIGDPRAILGTTWSAGSPVIALLEEIRGRIEDPAREWLHFGATTQDVVDTAHMLAAKQGLETLDESLTAVARRMGSLIEDNPGLDHMGRTFMQDAGSVPFGATVAGWLHPTLRHIVAMREIGRRLPVQLGGPVGDLSPYGARGPEIVSDVAARLGLSTPTISWHTDRTVMWALTATVADAVASVAKVAGDVVLLSSSEIGEISVRSGGSSSIPGKQNPIDAVRVLAAHEVCRGASAMIRSAGAHQLQRGAGPWHAEWVGLPLVFRSAAASFDAARVMFEGLTVNAAAMSARAGTGSETPAGIDPQIDAVLHLLRQVDGET